MFETLTLKTNRDDMPLGRPLEKNLKKASQDKLHLYPLNSCNN